MNSLSDHRRQRRESTLHHAHVGYNLQWLRTWWELAIYGWTAWCVPPQHSTAGADRPQQGYLRTTFLPTHRK
ncbi:MAG: hypothetical protein N2663_05480 [Chlorobi bacterium]|nr:hypothetical protein [Chlorobiota bacterium]